MMRDSNATDGGADNALTGINGAAKQASAIVSTHLDNKSLCIALLRADTEADATRILRDSGYLDSNSDWVLLGESETNFSICGNQADNSVAALVEKLVNSIEAEMIAEVRRRGIDPTSNAAPSTIEEAVRMLLEVPTGHLKDLPAASRRRLVKVHLVVTGGARNPCYTILDSGEGHAPAQWPSTFLSLPGSKRPGYKTRMKFVQGVYNMGGTGVLPFCGKQSYELIISRRDPSIAKPGEEEWGLTIIRRRVLTDKALAYEYLAPNGKILSFSSEELPLMYDNYPEAYGRPFQWGTCIKLYEYKHTQSTLATSHSGQDLYYELSRYLFEVPLPVKIVERRTLPGFEKIHTHETVLAGMSARLESDRSNLIEITSSGAIKLPELGKLDVTTYLFVSSYNRPHWRERKAITLLINGQMHGYLSDDFFVRNAVDLSYLKTDLYVILDCSKIPIALRQQLFMPSRERLRDSEERAQMFKALEEFLHDHPALRDANDRRHNEDIKSKLEDHKPFEQILERLIKVSPSLTEILLPGSQITKLVDFDWLKRRGPYSGKRHPTFFRPEGHSSISIEKDCPIAGSCFVHFETDAENEYFSRKNDPGKLDATDDVLKSYNLSNGICSIRFKPPAGAAPGEKTQVIVRVTDPKLQVPFECTLTLNIIQKKNGRRSGTERAPSPQEEKQQRFKKPVEGEGEEKIGFSTPKVEEVYQPDWHAHDFTDKSALDLKPYSGSYEVYVNMDNCYLQNELLTNKKEEAEVLKMQFKWGLALIAWSMIVKFEKDTPTEGKDDKKPGFIESVRETSKGIAMVLLPLINSMGSVSRSVSRG